jgi:hypothetical protein
MKILGTIIMVFGGLWAFGGLYHIGANWDPNRSEFTAFAMVLNGVVYIIPGAVVLGVGAILRSIGQRRARAAATGGHGQAPGGQLVACRTCHQTVALDAPTCPHCGAPEPARYPGVADGVSTVPNGQSKKSWQRRVWIAAALIGGVILVLYAARTPSPSTSTAGTSAAQPNLFVRVEKDTYDHGYLKLVGTVVNRGSGGAYSPTITVTVYDSSGVTLLASDTARPAGQFMKVMEPGASAAFQTFSAVPGQPARIQYRVSVEKYPFDVELPRKR